MTKQTPQMKLPTHKEELQQRTLLGRSAETNKQTKKKKKKKKTHTKKKKKKKENTHKKTNKKKTTKTNIGAHLFKTNDAVN